MPGKEKKYLAFPVYPGVTPLDLVGPLTVLRNLTFSTPYRTVVVGERVERFATGARMGVLPAASFTDVPAPFAVVVPGAGPATVAAMEDDALVGYVRSAAQTADVVGSTGTGALVLAAAGLLDGVEATTHWAFRDQLAELGARPVPDRVVERGKIVTAAGVSSGIDMALRLVQLEAGDDMARAVQTGIAYDPEPPFDSGSPEKAPAPLVDAVRRVVGAG